MSKAFTKEEDDAGFVLPARSSRPPGPFHLTPTGARRLRSSGIAELDALLAQAEIVRSPEETPERAAIGVRVRVRGETGEDRHYLLVSSEEHALLGEGCSVHSPLGRALLGARVGDVRELRAPRGDEQLEIVALEADRGGG